MRAHWITFLSLTHGVKVTVKCDPKTALYVEKNAGLATPYQAARARAARIIKRRLGLHPCSSSRRLDLHPHDWSIED